MNYIGFRIKKRRKELGFSAEKLAEMVHVSPATIYRYEKNEIANMGADKLQPIAAALSTTPGTLMGWIDDSGNTPPAPDLIPVRKVRIPLLGEIAAGEPILATETHEEYIGLDADAPRSDYALRVISDSMEPTIRVGDTVLIRQQEDVDDGRIAAVLMDDHTALKRVRHIKGGLLLISDNTAKYEPRAVLASEFDTLRILGLAVAYRRNL